MYKKSAKEFRKLGFKVIKTQNSKSENGPDFWVEKAGTIFTVEVKTATKNKTKNSCRVHPISRNRVKDDFISIEFPDGYVLIEPMRDHLRLCSNSGYRSFGFYE